MGVMGGSSGTCVKAYDSKPNGRMYMSIGTAMMGAMMFGIDCANFGDVQGYRAFTEFWCLGNFGDEHTCGLDGGHGADHNNAWLSGFLGWAATLYTLGAAFGALTLASLICEKGGRRMCISVGGVVSALGCFLTSYLDFGSVVVFQIGRVLTGFGVGICCYALPLYNAEVSAPSIRGATGSLFQVNTVLGQIVAVILAIIFPNWRFGMVLPGIAALLVAGLVWTVPESPRYVMAKKGYEAGLVVLSKVRDGDATQEALDIKEAIESEAAAGEVSWSELFSEPSLRRRVFIACWLQFAQQLTGVNAFLGYFGTLASGLGVDPLVGNIAFNGGMLPGVLLGLYFLDSGVGGRRIQLLGAKAVMVPALLLGALAKAFAWSQIMVLVMVCIFGIGFQLAWGMIPWVYPSELFSMSEKGKAMSLAVFSQYMANAVVFYVTPVMMGWSFVGTLFIFAALNFANLLFVVVFVKETKGVPLEEVPALFGKTGKAADKLDEVEIAC